MLLPMSASFLDGDEADGRFHCGKEVNHDPELVQELTEIRHP